MRYIVPSQVDATAADMQVEMWLHAKTDIGALMCSDPAKGSTQYI